MWKEAKWIGVPQEEVKKWNILEGDMTGRFTYFRHELNLAQKASLTVCITANSRYRLWVNERPVLSGPCKGDEYRHYYETVELTEYLREGKNVLAVTVLYNDPDAATNQSAERASVFGVRTPRGGHRLAVEGTAFYENGVIAAIVTTGQSEWKAYLDGSFYLKSNEITLNLGAICEETDLRRQPADWKKVSSAVEWCTAKALESVVQEEFPKKAGLLPRIPVCDREIPLMDEIEGLFVREITQSKILESGEIDVLPGNEAEIILDAGVHTNGYPAYWIEGGEGRRISFTYFERFEGKEKKIKHSDWKNGEIIGLTDQVTANGKSVVYEPFWYRTFRYVRICVDAGNEKLTLHAPVFRKTGYPLEVESHISSSEEWVGKVWEICVRTLQNCMMETYMDCPYYEQMQFPMDTRLQALFTYAVSQDVRLARKALKDFHHAMMPSGLIPGKYPSAYCQVISTFSLHYIFMLEEYYRQTGDTAVLKEYRPDVDMILSYYDRKIGKDGLVGRLGYWEFVDWQEAWKESFGMPAALTEGASTIINLMYGYALLCGARINEMTGRSAVAEEYRERQRKIAETVRALCWDEEAGLFREGPQFFQFSQHAQSWAVLNGMLSRRECSELMSRTQKRKVPVGCEPMVPVSFSTAYEYFRAMEEAGIYDGTEENLMRWAELLEWDYTTCPEEPENGRSECHAWSALPLYEMIRCLAGIQGDEGWETVTIRPHLVFLPDLAGEAATPRGRIQFSYQKERGNVQYRITLPKGLNGVFYDPEGKKTALTAGVNIVEYQNGGMK